MASPLRALTDRLYIADKTRGIVQLRGHYTPMQERILDVVDTQLRARRPVRIRVLKARQMGCSTIVQAIMFSIAVALNRIRGLTIAHDTESSEHLLGMSRTYWDTFVLHDCLTPANLAASRLGWVENNSRLTIATAKNSKAARSKTIHAHHGSEVAFWDDPAILLKGLYQAIPRKPLTFSFQESTANGVGNWWHNAWNASKKGESDESDDVYTPLFFGWWEHPEYVGSAIGHGHLLSVPWTPIDDEERLLERFLKRQGMDPHDIHDRLLWRRDVIRSECSGDVETFHQEYPTTDTEAFVSTGRNVFAIQYLRNAYEPFPPLVGRMVRENNRARFIEDPNGPVKVYVKPGRGQTYMIGGDSAWAATGDFACAQVLNRRSWEQCAVFRQKVHAEVLGEQMVLLGLWYNNAMQAPEMQKAGGAALATIRARGYDNIVIQNKTGSTKGQQAAQYGWYTSDQAKHELVSNMQAALYDAAQPHNRAAGYGIRIHDQQTYAEMKEYVVVEGRGTFGNSDGTDHDDCVMAFCIALSATIQEAGNMLGGGTSAPRFNDINLAATPTTQFEEQMADMDVRPAPVMVGAGKMKPAPLEWVRDDNDDFYSGDL